MANTTYFNLSSLYRYDTKDPANALLNSSYRVDSYGERSKPYLTLKGAGELALKFTNGKYVLEPNTVYIAKCKGASFSTIDEVASDLTMPKYKLLGLEVYNTDVINFGDSTAKFVIKSHQYLEVSEGDTIYKE